MIFVFDENAGNEFLHVKGELFKYLFKVRRHQEGDVIDFRQENAPDILYRYVIESMDSRTAILRLIECVNCIVKAARDLHIIWCMIDPKSVEKVLPFLNEIGVSKISFVSCDRSQKNFKPDFQRFRRILSSSMQQCGRSQFMEFEILSDLHEALKQYDSLVYFDFCDTTLEKTDDISTILIGCEGGFTQKERELFKNQRGYRLDSLMILRSESAVCAISSKILF